MPVSIDFEIVRREPFADGASFGNTGAYETIEGRARLQYKPGCPSLTAVPDASLAKRNSSGLVEVVAEVWLLRPVLPGRGNGAFLCEFINRGNKRCLQFFNDAPDTNSPDTMEDAGNGFLFRRGYTIGAVAWQGDVLPGDGRMLLEVPMAVGEDGPVTGRIKVEFVVDAAGVTSLPLSAKYSTRSYPTMSMSQADAVLTRRRYPWSEPQVLAASDWCFARVERDMKEKKPGDSAGGESALVPSASHIHLYRGFETGWIYELTYTAGEPIVLGLGMCAVRDVVSFLRNDRTTKNPLFSAEAPLSSFYGWGRSQAGRCVREFLYGGYNGDSEGRRVFDGMITHIAGAGKLTLNRFSNLVVAASRQYEDALNPSDLFPFSYAKSTDHLTGKEDAILKHPDTDPYVIHSHTSSEYWNRRGSLVHTDTQGNDLNQPDKVRIYHWASSQHWSDPRLKGPMRAVCDNYLNSTGTAALFRSTLDALHAWVREGKAPPPSQIPRRDNGSLVPFETWLQQFPKIPGVALPASANRLPLVEYGPDFNAGGPAPAEPEVKKESQYAVLVPAVDEDGNEVAGIRVPTISAPLGTFTGWNRRSRGFGHGALHDFSGSYIPLPESSDEATSTADPRKPISARYQDKAAYVAAIEHAGRRLIESGLLLQEDFERELLAAKRWGRPRHLPHGL